jgi:hypothetical protein
MGALALKVPYTSDWVLTQSSQTCSCLNDIVLLGDETTPCLQLPFGPQCFEFLYPDALKVRMCLEEGCRNCQLLEQVFVLQDRRLGRSDNYETSCGWPRLWATLRSALFVLGV